MRPLSLTGLFLLILPNLQAQCTVNAFGDTTAVCPGTPLGLNASPGFTSYSWSPATGLSNPNIANPTFTATSNITYVLTATMGTGNLITNGDFALGNVGFTSAQNYSSIYNICNYYVNSMYFAVPAYTFPDHTPTADNMFMSVDGCTGSPTVIYETTVAVTPSTNYDFSFWASRADAVQPDFEMHLVGNVTGDVIVATHAGIPYAGTWTWDEYTAPVWNSGPNTSVIVRIKNLETGGYGNDFALDDIYFGTPVCTATDSVTITVLNTGTVSIAGPDTLCRGQSITLTASGAGSYTWSNNATTSSITISPVNSMVYSVMGDVGFGCTDTATHNIVVLPAPLADITGNNTICEGQTVTLQATGGAFYNWSTGASTSLIVMSNPPEGEYWVVVSDPNNCSDTGKIYIMVQPAPPPPVITADTTVCQNTFLPPLGPAAINIFWYTDPNGTGTQTPPVPNTNIPGTHTYYATIEWGGCTSYMTSTSVTVNPMPYFEIPQNLEICEDDSVLLEPFLEADWQYSWSDSLVSSSRYVNHEGVYILSAFNQCGTFTDSCLVEVKDCHCYFYLPNAFTPNEDLLNDFFQPVYSCTFKAFSLRIFNRWGQVVFESNDPDAAWDGKHNGLWSPLGVYVVLVQYSTFIKGEYTTHELRRHLTLVK